jgi:hypothetical protein
MCCGLLFLGMRRDRARAMERPRLTSIHDAVVDAWRAWMQVNGLREV